MSFFSNAIERLIAAREAEAQNYISMYSINLDDDASVFGKDVK